MMKKFPHIHWVQPIFGKYEIDITVGAYLSIKPYEVIQKKKRKPLKFGRKKK